MSWNGSGTIPTISEREYILWRDLLMEEIGLCITEDRLDFLSRRLWRRMKEISLCTYGDYFTFVTQEGEGRNEWRKLVESLVNCRSAFLRHEPSYEALMREVLPELVRKKRSTRDPLLSMWSSGCARGQEAYSLAMCFAQVFGCETDVDLRVIGTDTSRTALDSALKAEYSLSQLRDMPQSFMDKYMVPTGAHPHRNTSLKDEDNAVRRHKVLFRVREEIRDRVRFAPLNLNDPNDYWIAKQDVIFCQNVVIYFSDQGRAEVIRRLLELLKPGGYLFLAPGEAVNLRLNGVVVADFRDTLAYKRDQEAVHVQLVR